MLSDKSGRSDNHAVVSHINHFDIFFYYILYSDFAGKYVVSPPLGILAFAYGVFLIDTVVEVKHT